MGGWERGESVYSDHYLDRTFVKRFDFNWATICPEYLHFCSVVVKPGPQFVLENLSNIKITCINNFIMIQL